MEDKKSKSKTLKGFIRKFDFFGEYFAFRYKDEDKQSSVSGGIVCIVFYIIAIIYFLYNFIPFINHEIFSLQYYTVALNETEKLNIKEDKIMFAFGLTQNDKPSSDLNDLLEITVTFSESCSENTVKFLSNKEISTFNMYGCCASFPIFTGVSTGSKSNSSLASSFVIAEVLLGIEPSYSSTMPSFV